MKILSMLKLLILTILLSNSLYAKSVEDKVKTYIKHMPFQQGVKVEKIKFKFKKDVGDNWQGLLYHVDLDVNGKKHLNYPIYMFSNGNFVTPELKTVKGLDLKRLMHPKLDKRYTDKKNLIAGNHNAKHKIVIFSDPLCPNCTFVMPKLIKDVQANPNKLGLYYISMPLDRLHPTARTLIKASKVAIAQGVKDVPLKVYTAKFEKFFDPYQEKDNQKALDAFNKVLGTKITMKQVENQQINKVLEHHVTLSEEAMINGTPTIFFDGEVDITRNKYKEVIK